MHLSVSDVICSSRVLSYNFDVRLEFVRIERWDCSHIAFLISRLHKLNSECFQVQAWILWVLSPVRPYTDVAMLWYCLLSSHFRCDPPRWYWQMMNGTALGQSYHKTWRAWFDIVWWRFDMWLRMFFVHRFQSKWVSECVSGVNVCLMFGFLHSERKWLTF